VSKWKAAILENSKFPDQCSNFKKEDSMALLQGFIQDIIVYEEPCKHEYSEPCENVLKGTCLIVFPNSTLRVVIYPKKENNTIYFVSCRD